jgi:hypothetical protein
VSGSSNGVSSGGDDADSQQEMRAFDDLPPDVRELLNYAVLDWSAHDVWRQSPGGTVTSGPVVITRPDRRTPHIQAIKKQEARFPPPLCVLPGRPLRRGRR